MRQAVRPVRKFRYLLAQRDGQSIVEFLLFLPIMLLLTYTSVRVNMAIQAAIVNQKYARAQTFFLASNAAKYPDLFRRAREGNFFGEANTDQMNLGVSDNAPPDQTGGLENSSYTPKATVITVTRRGKPIGNDEPQKEDHWQRGRVRIRNNVSLCTQFNPQNFEDISQPGNFLLVQRSANFRFCRSPYDK